MFVDAMFGGSAAEAFTWIRTASETDIARIVRAVAGAQPSLTLTVESSAHPAAGVLLRGSGPDDLLVVGPARHDGVSAVVLGNTTRRVVGVDGSAASEHSVRWASDEADRHDVGLVIVHGWAYPYAPDDAHSAQARQLTEIDAACTLERSVEAARTRCGIEVTGRLVENSAVSALLETRATATSSCSDRAGGARSAPGCSVRPSTASSTPAACRSSSCGPPTTATRRLGRPLASTQCPPASTVRVTSSPSDDHPARTATNRSRHDGSSRTPSPRSNPVDGSQAERRTTESS
jgi:nucleotide-binding universal stress UspA family protein